MSTTKLAVSPTLKGYLKRYLKLKGEAARLDNELKAVKELIDYDMALLEKQGLFQNQKLAVPGVAMVSIALNPPKLVWASDGHSLTIPDREGVALLLPDRFVKQDINVSAVHKAIERGDTALLTVLTAKGVQAVQEQRFDVKAG